MGIDLNAAVIQKFNATSEKYGLKTHFARLEHGGYILLVLSGY